MEAILIIDYEILSDKNKLNIHKFIIKSNTFNFYLNVTYYRNWILELNTIPK